MLSAKSITKEFRNRFRNQPCQSLRRLLSSVLELGDLEDMIRKGLTIFDCSLENGFRTWFSISTQLRSTNAKIDVEEILKNENPETRDYIYRIERESIDRRKNFCFVRYKCGSDSENPIFDDELKQFQIYTEVGTIETNRKAECWFRDDLRICC